MEWYRKAAEQEDTSVQNLSQNIFGVCFLKGKGAGSGESIPTYAEWPLIQVVVFVATLIAGCIWVATLNKAKPFTSSVHVLNTSFSFSFLLYFYFRINGRRDYFKLKGARQIQRFFAFLIFTGSVLFGVGFLIRWFQG